MPASCIYEDVTMVSTPYNPNPQQSLDDQRTLTLALELMGGSDDLMSHMAMGSFEDPNLMATMTEAERAANKRSQNMTECVTVPSSEHVAEIVGRQGCKIKALRAKTNTYIKTPVRGEEPIFVVTGRKEDVANARREILSAADHFSQIRACRKNNLNGSMAPGPPVNVPGQVTISVRVPYRVVGLVVGPKGATIKRIQQQTQTYIVTPSRDKEPVFEVTGLPDNVDAAKKEIEAHIAMRTGTLFEDEAMANIAATHNITIDTLLANPDLLNCYRSTPNNLMGNGSANGLGTTSLNALLSSNAPSHSLSSLGLSNMLPSNQFSNFNSHVSGNGGSLSNGHPGLPQSLSNGVGNSSYNGSILNGIAGRTNSLLTGLGEISLSALSSAMSLNTPYNSQLENQQSSSGSNHFDMSAFSVLGETANNLLNASKNPGLDAVSSTPSILNAFRSNPGTDFSSMGSVLPNSVGGVDEGLGSLESSMGSSPALDQPQGISSNIWSESRFPNPLPFSSYSSRNGFSSGEHTPSTRLSPNRLLSHDSAHRTLSDPLPQMESITNALSRLGTGNALYRRSNSSSPELGDLATQAQFVSSLATSSGASMFQTSSAATSTSSMASSAAGSSELSTLMPGFSQAACDEAEGGPSSASVGSRRGSVDSAPAASPKQCLSCDIMADAVFIPCGHNKFCVECADKVIKAGGVCPSCQSKIEKALKIRP